ncbi:hypothetical protein BDV19DRAFT_354238 [Aspergillus venezuelensis]
MERFVIAGCWAHPHRVSVRRRVPLIRWADPRKRYASRSHSAAPGQSQPRLLLVFQPLFTPPSAFDSPSLLSFFFLLNYYFFHFLLTLLSQLQPVPEDKTLKSGLGLPVRFCLSQLWTLTSTLVALPAMPYIRVRKYCLFNLATAPRTY